MRSIIILAAFHILDAIADQNTENVNDFNLVDINNDGTITKPEFEEFYQKRVESNKSKARRLFASYDLDANEKLTVAEFVPLAFSLSRQPLKEESEFFNRLDQNSDGTLTRAEIRRSKEGLNHEIIEGLFAVADSNNDGKITRREYETATGSSGKTDANKSGLAQSLIASIDGNHDQQISKAEVAEFTAHFNQNKVSSSDINNLFNELDANRDGFLDVTELQNAPEKISKVIGIRPMPNISIGK